MNVAEPTDSSRGVGQRLRRAAPDLGIIAACWAFVAFLSTAQRWTWLNTPDAEFYASLGLFGHDVTDRTVTPVYYWTRLGTIAPVRLLTKMLGPWTGYHVFWLLLIAVIVAAVYLMLRRFTTRLVAALMALLTCLSTVILAFLGNPYVTGTAMAAMFVIIAGTVWTVPRAGDPAGAHDSRAARYAAPVLVGLAFGWVAMTNPNATFISAAVWLVATAIIAIQRRGDRVRYLLRTVAGRRAGCRGELPGLPRRRTGDLPRPGLAGDVPVLEQGPQPVGLRRRTRGSSPVTCRSSCR